MKILHVNTYDTGGAAGACMRIHQSLLSKGIDSKVLVLYKTKEIPNVYSFNYYNDSQNKIIYYIKRRIFEKFRKQTENFSKLNDLPPVEIFTNPVTIYDITSHPLYKEADLIQLNWVSGFLDEPSFFKKNKKPVIWRMPDLYACGGGYHYEKGFPFNAYHKYLKRNFIIRKKSIANKNITFVAISEWVKQKALESELIKEYPLRVISNGIDTNIFKQYDKLKVRKKFGIPLDKKIILIGAASFFNIRKGMHLLIESINELQSQDTLFYSFGHIADHPNINSLEHITDEVLLSQIYSAADIFIMSSIEEAFGQVFIEALSCGTPVVSFPNGGALDIIKDGFNGILAKDFTSKSLTDAIIKTFSIIFDNKAIRDDIILRFNAPDKADQYIQLYKDILNK
ncbi:glycosyltransferase [Dysgonomonas sp. Marseille-P4677]|uniref:glycosyltransferase n=1 Tax=Dysgonomonas sp. Marseille-P4677 TaxID=2364790 RepID=UPI0019141529|nr:glycosyltransferase [Dysgonomonas sp. Marseille-P4677]MBK5721755.1 glycosyltransferase [Dysgonomonas sp. Marseille-P4677]